MRNPIETPSNPSRLTGTQIATAYAICQEFGEGFDGIKDRVDAVASAQSSAWSTESEIAEAVTELLSSVSPTVRARILNA